MTATTRIDLRDIRIAGAVMLGAGLVRGLMHSSVGVPCPLRTLTGVPCPLCGMTTSVSAAATLDLRAAVAATPAGVLAVLLALVLVARPRVRSLEVPRWAIPTALIAMWVWQLFRFGFI